MKVWQWARRAGLAFLRWLWRYSLRYLFWTLFILAFLPGSIPPVQEIWYAAAYEISPNQFDYVGWEINALAAKTGQTLFGMHPFMDETARSQFVREYMADLARVQQLEAQITALYTDPMVDDPAAVSETLRTERDALRAEVRSRQLTAEAILEGQVAVVLVDEGFGVMGQLMPPIAMHFTEVPNLLIVSPRDRIALDVSLNLYALPVNELVALEQKIEQRYNVSALIVPLGGIALYPAMITETASLPRAVEVFAHEWLHHYLFFFPLGLHYFTGGEGFASETRIINETTADLFGKEMARRVLQRYYPDLVPPDSPLAASPAAPTEIPAFDFAAEMNTTRVTVDKLLAEGKVIEAENYMEERRRFFYDNGYHFRRINQAFFAFYGGYQGGAVPGVGGEDPIGPAVQTIRKESRTLYDFVVTMRDITTRAELVETAQSLTRN